MIGPSIGQPMDQERIPVIREDDGLVGCEEHVKLFVAQAVRVLALRLELHQIDDVDDPHFQIGNVEPHQFDWRRGSPA
jgi:hypothetical protein